MKSFLLLLPIIMVLCSCTSIVWRAKTYEENVSGFYIVPDKNIAIVSGDRYSYVIDAKEKLQNILLLSRTVELTPYFTNLELVNSNITGQVQFFVPPNTQVDVEPFGFIKNSSGTYTFEYQFKGQRYLTIGDYPFEKLDDKIPIEIKVSDNTADLIRKIVLTPVSIAIDGVVIIPIGSVFVLCGVLQAVES